MATYWPDWVLDDYCSTAPWHDQVATSKQREALRRRGFTPPTGLTKGEANHALNRPTCRQLELLDARGYDGRDLTFEQATNMINRIANQEGWGDQQKFAKVLACGEDELPF